MPSRSHPLLHHSNLLDPIATSMSSSDLIPIRRALISVSDKTDLLLIAKALTQFDVEILSTGGSAEMIAAAAIPVTDVSHYTGFAQMMDGRLKTLHPRIHGGLLGRVGLDDAVMVEHDIPAIDLLIVNFYPFSQGVARSDCRLEQAIELIDIGGPAMLRSAAKNFARVATVTSTDQYAMICDQLADNAGKLSLSTRFELAVAAFNTVARYDAAISNYFSSISHPHPGVAERSSFPAQLNQTWVKLADLRYGENPHQHAALYQDSVQSQGPATHHQQLQGKELSYNNLVDAQTAWDCVQQFDASACVIVKHANPCGVACAPTCVSSYDLAYQTDPTSAFGGIIAFNQCVDGPTLDEILQRQFVEVIIAPGYTPDALAVAQRKPSIRLLQIDAQTQPTGWDLKRIGSGLLVQEMDSRVVSADALQTVTTTQPNATQRDDLLFAWKVAKFVKSNAIVYAKDNQTIGVGAGQMSRVYSARIAAIKAEEAKRDIRGSVMASDAFFPFRDAIDAAASAGVSAIIQPGGSIRDQEVIDAANAHGIAMVFTGVRHFRH